MRILPAKRRGIYCSILDIRLLLIGIAALFLFNAPSVAGDYDDVVIADAHVHLLDFLQNGDYLDRGVIVAKHPGMALPAGQRGKQIEALLWAMDRANVSHALVAGMPFLKKWAEDESFPACSSALVKCC